ncbi:MAG: hypothetical protein WC391_02730 [Methanoregula sp.]|jgi:hypothetical protein
MTKGFMAIIILMVAMFVSMGCSQTVSEPVPTPTPVPARTLVPAQTPESPVSTVLPSAMALQLSDIPEDYILKDRADTIYQEQSPLSRDLGWRMGYSVTFYRVNLVRYDLTGLQQIIDVYPIRNMNKVFDMAQDEMESRADGTITVYEIPLYRIGDQSIAYKTQDPSDPGHPAIYSILFVKKDVFEKLEMGGTTTDYETLKQIANTAAGKIR